LFLTGLAGSAGQEACAVIPRLRSQFNRDYSPEKYLALLARLEERCGVRVDFRVAETPVFLEKGLLDQMADIGAELASRLIANSAYMEAAHRSIPPKFFVPGEIRHPHFLTADFGLVRNASGGISPKLVELQAFPSVYAYQAVLAKMYQCVYELDSDLGSFLGGLDKDSYLELFSRTVLGGQDPLHVVLMEVDPNHQKTRADFEVTARKLGLTVLDITSIEAERDELFYRNAQGKRIQIHRIYNRAIVDELIARNIQIPFDMTKRWDVEWAGHPNWYFLISKYSLPWLTRWGGFGGAVPPAVFLDEFLAGDGRQRLQAAGVELPPPGVDAVYRELLLKPLFSFAGKGIQFDPTHAQLEAIPPDDRCRYLVQQRVQFEPTIDTPAGMTQAEIRILYLWPDRGTLRPALPLVRLGRGKMMGVDHNRGQEWVGGSAAFYPTGA
jgi:hypothetical protein